MFSQEQLKVLSNDLDNSRVKTIDKAGMSFKYLETYDVINVANTIFNYMWDYTITRLEEVARETNQNGNHAITFSAIVKVKIYDENRNFIEREDTGVGTGTARSIGDAIDNASKSAVSDSLKRVLRSLGAQFGNDLYQKTPQNSKPAQIQQTQSAQQITMTQPQNNVQQEYYSLYNIGLSIMTQGSNLVIIGDDIFNKKDSIKACGFRWSGENKVWYKPLDQQAA
jgi:DNA repair and recombination protein RAD52